MTVSLLQNYKHTTERSARPAPDAALYKLGKRSGSRRKSEHGFCSRCNEILLKKKKKGGDHCLKKQIIKSICSLIPCRLKMGNVCVLTGAQGHTGKTIWKALPWDSSSIHFQFLHIGIFYFLQYICTASVMLLPKLLDIRVYIIYTYI